MRQPHYTFQCRGVKWLAQPQYGKIWVRIPTNVFVKLTEATDTSFFLFSNYKNFKLVKNEKKNS